MNFPIKVLPIIMGTLLGFGPTSVKAGSNPDLIDLLEKKGTITQEEADALKAKSEPLFSLRGGKFKLGGELELEFVDSQKNNDPGNNPYPRMAIDKIVFSPQVRYSDAITFRADVQASGGEGNIKLDEAWVKFKGLPFNTWIQFGLEDVFMKPHRKTESYPVLGYAFWQDEDLGVYLGGGLGPVYWRVSATNGRILKDRRISEDKAKDLDITTDDDDNIESNGNKQVGIGIGIDHEWSKGHKIDLLPFYYTARLSDADAAYLQGINGYGASDERDQTRFGLNAEYLCGGLTLFAQVMQATDGEMDRDGWYLQPSYKLKFKERKTFTAVEFLARYEVYNVDLVDDPTDSRTWDRQTTTLAVITTIAKNLKLKTEYYLNNEDTGGANVNNDELLVQLEAKF